MRLAIPVLALLILVGVRPGATQQPGRPDSAMMAQMAGMFDQMGPMYESMSPAMIEGTIKALAKPATVECRAGSAERYYEALIERGCSKDEALQIVAGAGIAGMKAPG